MLSSSHKLLTSARARKDSKRKQKPGDAKQRGRGNTAFCPLAFLLVLNVDADPLALLMFPAPSKTGLSPWFFV
jgi:hypothetical protein